MITITPENRATTNLKHGDIFKLQGDNKEFQALASEEGCAGCQVKHEKTTSGSNLPDIPRCLKMPSCFYPQNIIFVDVTEVTF